MTRPWIAYQERLRAAGGTALLVTRAAAATAVGGHERIAVYQSDPPFPSVFLPLEGPPHVCTPDPDGAMHLPADHVHPVLFDPAGLAARVPDWLGTAAAGPVFIDVSSPDAYAWLRAVLPGAELRDATPILGSADLAPWAEHDQPDVAAARRARFLDVAARWPESTAGRSGRRKAACLGWRRARRPCRRRRAPRLGAGRGRSHLARRAHGAPGCAPAPRVGRRRPARRRRGLCSAARRSSR